MTTITTIQSSAIQCDCGYVLSLSNNSLNSIPGKVYIQCNCGIEYQVNYSVVVFENHAAKLAEENRKLIERLRELEVKDDNDVFDDNEDGDD